jgi:hypothetical protein
MSAKHTPGPWRVEESCDGYEIWTSGSSDTSATVADIIARPSVTGAADARLIAAAPELKAALMAFLALSASIRPWRDGRAFAQIEMEDEARALLARIDGVEALLRASEA